MPRPKATVPAYRLHKASERAVVYIDRREVYLGPYGSPESKARYADLVAQRLAQHDHAASQQPAPARSMVTVNQLCLRFLTDYCRRYRRVDGRPSAEVDCFKGVIRHLEPLYGETPANDFGPLRARQVRQAMIDSGWSLRYINKQMGRLRLLFRVGVSWELVDARVLAGLDSIPSLVAQETTASVRPPRRAVPEADLRAVRAQLSPRHRDIFDLLLLTGARPGELLGLIRGDIDQSGDVWRAELAHHKTAGRGQRRVLLFNAAAQAILQRHLPDTSDERLFALQTSTFSAAVGQACRRAGVTPFVPHQLRHSVATRLADEVGTDAAQRLLGHATRAMTEHYSRAAERQAREAVQLLTPPIAADSPPVADSPPKGADSPSPRDVGRAGKVRSQR